MMMMMMMIKIMTIIINNINKEKGIPIPQD